MKKFDVKLGEFLLLLKEDDLLIITTETTRPTRVRDIPGRKMTNDELILKAKKAREHAYTPTNCAGRTAFFRAVYEGEREFTKIAVVGGPENLREALIISAVLSVSASGIRSG